MECTLVQCVWDRPSTGNNLYVRGKGKELSTMTEIGLILLGSFRHLGVWPKSAEFRLAVFGRIWPISALGLWVEHGPRRESLAAVLMIMKEGKCKTQISCKMKRKGIVQQGRNSSKSSSDNFGIWGSGRNRPKSFGLIRPNSADLNIRGYGHVALL